NNVGPTNVNINQNAITGNQTFGVQNVATTTADGTCNWWGAADGPGGQGPGSGDAVSTKVTFNPFKTAAVQTCPAPTDVVIKPGSMHGWVFVNEATNQLEQGTFVTGPATPPKGTGSVQFTAATATDNHSILTGQYADTPLSAISQLDYWTNQSGPTVAVALRFDVRYRTSDTAYGGRLVFEPYINNGGTVPAGWQHWNALDGAGAPGSRAGLWWASNTGPNGSNGVCGQATPCTWAQILNLFPDAKVNPSNGNFALGVGSGVSGFVGQADALTIGVPGSLKTFDFEAPAPTLTRVTPGGMHGWSFVNEQTDATESGTFATGPATPPLGTGSVELQAQTAPESHSILTHQFAGTPLSAITALDYWS